MFHPAPVDGHDAPISLPQTTLIRLEEGLQRDEDVDLQQAPNSSSENTYLRRQTIPWDTHPRRMSIIHDNHQGSLVDVESRRGSENSTIQSYHPPVRRQTTMSGISEDTPRDPVLTVIGRQELDPQATRSSTEVLNPGNVPSEKSLSRLNHVFLRWLRIPGKLRHYIPLSLILILMAMVMAFIVLYSHAKTTPSATSKLTIITTIQSRAIPSSDSALAAATLFYSNLLSSPSNAPTTLIAYTTSNGSICIRTFTDTYLTPVQCITNLPLKPRTPITILDWYGGPSIFYLTTSNLINGLNSVPQNNTWTPSPINTQSPPPYVHPSSQLASVTWLNGSSAWLYFQDPSLQLREYGIDDYRDNRFRYGATGPLGLAIAGSGIGASRYLKNGSEVLEVFIQTDNNAIHGRVYEDSVWEADFYSVDDTTSGLNPNAAMTAATIQKTDGQGLDGQTEVLLAWVDDAGFVNVQSRETANVTAFNAFSAPEKLIEGDGAVQPGLAATGWSEARVWFADGVKIWDLQEGSGGQIEGNWTTTDVTSS